MTRLFLVFGFLLSVATAQDALRRFDAAVAAGDVAAMRREAEAAVAESPKRPEAHRALARAFETQADADAARGRTGFVSVLLLDAADAWVTASGFADDPAPDLRAAGRAALRAGDGRRGLSATARLASDGDPESRLVRARLHLLAGDGTSAMERLSAIAERADALGPIAEAAVLLGDRTAAERAAVAACATADGRVVNAVFAPLARAWRDGGDPRWGEFLRGVAARAGASPFLRWYTADAAFRAERFTVAHDGFRAYADAYPNDPLAWQCLALVLPKLGRFEDAEQALSRAVELGIDADRAGDALRRLVAATYGAAKYAEARQYQETLVAWFDDPSDRLDLGVLRLDAQDPEGAAAAYRAVAENDSVPRILRGRAWNFLALLHDGRGEFDRFHLAVARAIDTSDDVDARENLACRLIDEGRARDALPLLERIVREDPARIRSIYHLARARHEALVLPRR